MGKKSENIFYKDRYINIKNYILSNEMDEIKE